jgi:hypothetical protein
MKHNYSSILFEIYGLNMNTCSLCVCEKNKTQNRTSLVKKISGCCNYPRSSCSLF